MSGAATKWTLFYGGLAIACGFAWGNFWVLMLGDGAGGGVLSLFGWSVAMVVFWNSGRWAERKAEEDGT